jgi:hypothetical protein
MLVVKTIYSIEDVGFNVDNICYIKDDKIRINNGIELELKDYVRPSKSDLFHWSGGINRIIEDYEKSQGITN